MSKHKKKQYKEQIAYQEYPGAGREYKDRLFRLVFRRKEDLLDLYNAVNGTDYADPDALEVNTLDNVLYLSMKNDISFLIGGTMNLYEHQSSYNPNMPVRGLMYFSRLYEKYIAANEIDIYTSTPKKFPFPQYLVFYNGTREEPDRRQLRLSDLYDPLPAGQSAGRTPCLECTAFMLNINYGHNRELMEKCRRLEEYAIFIGTVRENLDSGMELDEAVTQAVDECMRKNVLKDILTEQKAEVIHMILETFDQELHEKTLRKEGYDEGKADGYKKGNAQGYEKGSTDGYIKGKTEERENSIRQIIKMLKEVGVDRETAETKLMESYSLSGEEAEGYLERYWGKEAD